MPVFDPSKPISVGLLSDLIHFDKYAKYIPELKRRETYTETVHRNRQMHIDHFRKTHPQLIPLIEEAYEFVERGEALPSMRSMQFAGLPIELAHNRIYNCAAVPISTVEAFSELMFLLLGGTGVGYSVQKSHIRKLPRVIAPEREQKFLISDDIIGWADAVRALMKAYLKGGIRPRFDYRDIRPLGALLKTTGGHAPGPGPLRTALESIERVLLRAIGRKLTSLEVHDICCFIADAVLAGGIRRAAMISLFSMHDSAMLKAKSNFPISDVVETKLLINMGFRQFALKYQDSDGELKDKELRIYQSEPGADEVCNALLRGDDQPWWRFEPQRGRSNNSAVVLRHRITKDGFQKLWKFVQESGSGDPGIVFSNSIHWLVNPCAEIALRCTNDGGQFCNLVEINCDGVKSQEDLNARARAAARIATLQAAYTDFHYIRPIWQEHTEKDALLGVSLTGIASGDLKGLDVSEAIACVLDENRMVSAELGIACAARAACVKPSGTAGLLLGVPAGIHTWFAPFFFRRIRMGKDSPLYKYLIQTVPGLMEDIIDDPSGGMACIKIPIAAPEGHLTSRDETALQFLDRVSQIQRDWITPGHVHGDNKHNVSATVYVDDHEWDEVGKWMWDNRENFAGLAVLPKDNGTYVQAPYEEIDEDTYLEALKHAASIDLTQVIEEFDNTDLAGELACAGGACEI